MSHPFKKRITTLKFDDVIEALCQRMREIPDPRSGSNTRYSMEQIGMAAFSVFFTQSPSFLSYQTAMQENKGNSNANTLFGVDKIPTDNHIRKQLDHLSPSHLFPLFRQIFEWLSEHHRLDPFRSIEQQLLIAMDGTQYHSSDSIHCQQCNCKTSKDGTVHYSHTVVTPVLVAPGIHYVLPLEPAFIEPQDGHNKQDCETAAAKRWIHQYGAPYAARGVTLLGDDLYSRTPLCRELLSEGFNFLFVCKPSSHKNLYQWIEEMEQMGKIHHLEIQRRRGKKVQIDQYRWMNQLPLYDGEEPLQVNWCELTTTDTTGKVLYRNSFASNHLLTDENMVQMVEAGRTRWKVENENNNTLKTKGYHLSHNFGHGKKNLSALLATMNLLSFLLHTLLEQMDDRYQMIRAKLPTRKRFYQDISALSTYMLFESFDSLLEFMMKGLELGPYACVYDSS